jgi:hypothetical protein
LIVRQRHTAQILRSGLRIEADFARLGYAGLTNARATEKAMKNTATTADLDKIIAAPPIIAVPTISIEGNANGEPHPAPAAHAKRFSR